MTLRSCGLKPDRLTTREADATIRPFGATGRSFLEGTTIQHIRLIINQQGYPSCAGQACAAGVDGRYPSGPRCSGVSIWREARRRQGRIEQIAEGTRFEYALEGLAARGWDQYRPFEEEDPIEAGTQDDLADELFADDTRDPDMPRWRITGDRCDAVDAALAAGYSVVRGIGVSSAYTRIRNARGDADKVVQLIELMGASGHGERIAGVARSEGRRVYLVQGSWSEGFGGCHLPDGTWQPGCTWQDEDTIKHAWDLHVFAPKSAR